MVLILCHDEKSGFQRLNDEIGKCFITSGKKQA